MKTTGVSAVEFRRLTGPVVTYKCVACQCEHAEGENLFARHLHRQSKHGLSDRAATPADVLRRLKGGD